MLVIHYHRYLQYSNKQWYGDERDNSGVTTFIGKSRYTKELAAIAKGQTTNTSKHKITVALDGKTIIEKEIDV